MNNRTYTAETAQNCTDAAQSHNSTSTRPTPQHRRRRRRISLYGIIAIVIGCLILAGGIYALAALIVNAESKAYAEQQATPTVATVTPTAEPTPAPRYALTAAERDTVERVVMAEAGGEPKEGQMLVAQCILNTAEKTGKAPSDVVVKYKYAKSRPNPTQRVKDAVADVFDKGITVTDQPIMYFYNPKLTKSTWHESMIFVIEVGGHRFFAERAKTGGKA